jgi:pilus assembly protein CpaB
MNKRFLGVLAFGVVVSVVASGAVYGLLGTRIGKHDATPVTHAVVITRDAPVGSLLRADDLKVVDWKGQLPRQALTAIDTAEGRGVIVALRADDLVLDDHLAAKGAGAGLAAKIPAGMRAVAVKVNEVVGLAGFVLPGVRVDVIACGTAPGKNDALGTQSRTILSNIEVLSAGQKIQDEDGGKPVTVQVVNLLVTPEQAEMMSLAGNETKVQLVLRNPSDNEMPKSIGSSTARLFNPRPEAAPVRKAAPRPKSTPAPIPAPVFERVTIPVTVEVIHGGNREAVKVGETVVERQKAERE